MLMLYAPLTGLGDTAAFLPRCPPDAMRLADGRSWRGVSANHTNKQACTTNTEGRLNQLAL